MTWIYRYSMTWIYRYTCAYPYTSLDNCHTTRWGVSDSPESSCIDLKGWSLWILSLAEQRGAAEAWIGRPSEALSFQSLCSAPEFSFVTREHLLYSSLLYISLYSRICYRWHNILVILYHILWKLCNCTLMLECIMQHMLSYSDSCMYWCLAYICEDILGLRIYVTVTSP